ncbi:MAG: putative 3-methyladenine glycosylase [Anaerolineales bacterium]|nr:putative 3-methyladenine DNA glycosylase [Anaerolineales bacterium]MBM2842368.1 putative 3-methyladenine glycosylase [Anaerolineales bacterium]
MARPRRLPRSFFGRSTLLVAHELLGQRLVRIDRGRRLSGWIIEAEAYIGQADLACHAHSGRTERNRVMWGEPGRAYVYFTYGMHWCLNVVTESTGRPAAVLLRALAPSEGLATMRRRRGVRAAAKGRSPERSDARAALGHRAVEGLADGPAKLCQALGVDRDFNDHDLCAPEARLFIESAPAAPRRSVVRGPRVGLDNVPEPWKSKPWRFRLAPERVPLLEEESA